MKLPTVDKKILLGGGCVTDSLVGAFPLIRIHFRGQSVIIGRCNGACQVIY